MSAALFKKAKQKALYLAILGLFSSGASGTPGAFLDANDWGPTGTGGTGVCFQDLSGTPVTAMEQPVQLILDKSQGLALGAEKIVNGSNPTTTTGWTPNAGSTLTVVSNKFRVQGQESYQAYATVVGALYKCSVDIAVVNPGAVYVGTAPRNAANYTTGQVAASATKQFYFIATATTTYLSMLPWNAGTEYCDFNNITVKKIAGNHAYVSASANRPVISARYNLLLATAVLSTQSVTVGAGSYTLYFTGSGSVALSGAATGTKTAGSNVITCTAGTLTLTVTGSVLTADLRPTDQTVTLPPYQAVVTPTNYDQSPIWPVLIKGNGSNQYLTGNLDLSGTNKVTVWAGVRKFSDSVVAILAELSANATSNNGAFYLAVPLSGAPNIGVAFGGTVVPGVTVSGLAAPKTMVMSVADSIPAPSIDVRINGAAGGSSVASQGTGNFGNYPYYLLSMAGTSLFSTAGFNSIIILGAAATAAQISTTEAWANSKVRAY